MRHVLDIVLIGFCAAIIVFAVRGAGAYADPTRRTLAIVASGFIAARRLTAVIDRCRA